MLNLESNGHWGSGGIWAVCADYGTICLGQGELEDNDNGVSILEFELEEAFLLVTACGLECGTSDGHVSLGTFGVCNGTIAAGGLDDDGVQYLFEPVDLGAIVDDTVRKGVGLGGAAKEGGKEVGGEDA